MEESFKTGSYYLTFASDKMHGNRYVRIEAACYDDARQAVIDHFGTKWSMLYIGQDFNDRHFPDGEWFAFQTDEHLNYKRLNKNAATAP